MSLGEGEFACLRYNDTHDQLSCMNDVKARLYLPVTIFLALLIIVGTLGNVTVCVVYWRRSSRVSSHYFILSLAILDLVTCVIGMPTEIADLVLPYTFESPVACKVLRFLHSSTIIASSTILIEVAFDRYYRICQLGRQFTASKARLLCVGALILGIIFSWPSCILFGRKTVDINLDGHILHGTDCSTADSMRDTIYPTIYYIFLFSLFGLTLAFFTVLYAKIGFQIMSQNKVRAGSSSAPRDSTTSRKSLFRSDTEKTTETSHSELSSEQDDGHPDRVIASVSSESSCALARPKIGTSSSANEEDPFDEEPAFSHNKWLQPSQSTPKENTVRACIPSFSPNPKITCPGNGNVNTSVNDDNNSNCFYNKSSDFCKQSCYFGNCCNLFLNRHRCGIEDISNACKSNSYCSSHHLQRHCHHAYNSKKFPSSTTCAETQRPCNRQLRVGKTTTVLFAVTLAYILSFLPYLTVMVMRSVVKGLEESLSPVGELAYKLCVKSFFINNAINPIIYSFLNQAFRKDAADAFRKLFKRRQGGQSGNFA